MSTTPQATRLLIVDDDPSTIRFLSHRFAQLGFEVESATDGLAALLMAGRRTPDVLITDVRMPKVDGPALARALAHKGGRMLTIVISAYDDPRIRAFCREVNAAYAKKGPKLWADIAMALAAAFPAIAARAIEPAATPAAGSRFTQNRAAGAKPRSPD
jgi:CheY-like chemotaxis protein